MTASKVDDLAKVQALLAECGLEKTAAALLDEAPQISKTNATVQAFLESTTSQGSGKRPRSSDSSSDSSSSSSSSSDSDSSSSSSSSSDSDSDSDSSSSSSSTSDSDSSSSSSSSDSDSDSSSSSDSSSDSDSDSDTKGEKVSKAPAKKRRLSLETPVKPKTEVTAPVPQTAPSGKDGRFAKRGETGNAPNTPFCRIRPEDVVYADERLKDNTYISKGGFENDFGYKAHMDLIVTRGKGFTKEKNKKKRGSYSGGKITMQSHSIKFD